VKLLAFVLLSLAAFAQSTHPKSASPKSPPSQSGSRSDTTAVLPDDGSVNENTYTSDYFGFRFTFPEGMGVDQDFTEGREDESHRSFLLLAATAHEEASNKTIVVMADSASAAGAADASSYLNNVAAVILKRQGFEPLGTARNVTYGGHAFARADFTRQSVNEAVLVTMLRGYAVNFLLIASSPQELNQLAASLETLEFTAPNITPGLAPANRK
jgi:hypothetical protein